VLEAEAAGFSSVWARDLVLRSDEYEDSDQEYEALIQLAYLAGVTQRISFGTAAVSLPFRHPAILARQAATLQALSGGRFTLGVGTGFRPDLYQVFGGRHADRYTLLAQSLQLMRGLWAGETLTADTPFGRFEGHRLGPLAKLPPPRVCLAGRNRPAAELLGALDGWLTHRRRFSTTQAEAGQFRDDAQRAGRPGDVLIDFAVALNDKPGTDFSLTWKDNVFPCGPAELVHALRAYSRIGISEVILAFVGSMPRLEQMRMVAAEVIPALAD
jgi:luciferase-type oxidoreductase